MRLKLRRRYLLKISVVIPALNEEACLPNTLRDLAQHQKAEEILVVDGGSSDRTCEIARAFGPARLIPSERGRARQLNRGADEASGDAFLFLHADTVLPAGGVDEVRRLLAGGQTCAGRFRMRFDSGDWLLRLYATYTRFQFFSYGDQAFFVTRDLFYRLGGFREDVPFEDIDFYRRVRRETRPVIVQSPVTTSARRFLKMGTLRQKWVNLALVGLYYLGFDVFRLKEKVYSDVR
jgi:rSAM/selenodomain-associated transferase 2